MKSEPSCIFCQIISGKIPCHKIYEDAHYLVFLDIHPITPGHALVVPKEHSPDLVHASQKIRQGLLDVVSHIAPAILEATHASAFNIGINTGKDSGQVVFHTHVHIIPRAPKDGLRSWENASKPSQDLTTLASQIAKKL